MQKYWVKNYFAHGSFPEVGQKQKTERKKNKERERLNDGDNKPPGPKKLFLRVFSTFYSQCLFTEAWTNPSPWSISLD